MKNLKTVDIYNTLIGISGLSSLITLFSSEPKSKDTTYGFISIVSTSNEVNSSIGYVLKEARVSITIVSEHQETLSTNEEDNVDTIIDLISNAIVDQGCTKIHERGDKNALYCIESDATPLLYNEHNRAYKIKDFIIGYEND